MTRCIRCRQGFTWECETGTCGDSSGSAIDPDSSSSSNSDLPPDSKRKVNKHDDANLRDPQSTGRKRAAIEYPLDPMADCEWKMRKNCGGGKHPITGCLDGKQQARHHGPDKDTLNNDEGNVHRICHTCHNRWHTENDEGYVWGALQPDHSPVEASLSEIAMSEAKWLGRKLVRAKD